MSTLSVNAQVIDQGTNSVLGGNYSAISTATRVTTRHRQIVKQAAEVPFTISAAFPGILVIAATEFDDPANADPAAVVRWGIATGVYPFELKVAESSVIRISSASPITTIFAIGSVAGTDIWTEIQSWDES